jgi:TonB family protein
MERTEEDLAQVVPGRPLTPDETRDMLTSVLETLAYLHAEGFVHGGLTPANIMASGDRIKISSDGLLRIGEPSDDLSARCCTSPPESHIALTPAADVWSIGMVMVEVLTQHAPVWDPDGFDTPAVPESLESPFSELARRCLRREPKLRCSVADIASALRPASHVPMEVPRIAPPATLAPAATVQPTRRRPYLLAGVVAASVIVVVGGLTGARLLSSTTDDNQGVASARAAMPEKPATAPVTPVAAIVRTPDATPASDAAAAPATPKPATTPEPDPATEAPVAKRSAAAPPAAGVEDHFVPAVPPQILRTIHGKVKVSVEVTIDPSGAVVDAKPQSASGSKYFGKFAADAVRRWKFKPAGDVASTRLVRFEFRKDGCQVLAD